MVTSKQLYQELRTVLAPLMTGAGFKSMAGGRLGWTRPSAHEHLFVWFQCDKWGWNESWGSTFTLEFQIAPGAGDAMTLRGRCERIGYLLEGFEELDELRRMNNSIIERLPGTQGGQAVRRRLEDGTDFVAEGFVIDAEKAIYGRDIWMNYYSLEDARQWAGYFGKKMLHFIALFEGQAKSPQGLARQRFNSMMGRVQAVKLLSEKVSILEAYVGTEPDAQLRSDAQHWLAEARMRTPDSA